ncbi:hypothetical protein JCM11641_001390 [Rhodosporidiobolus odoratus]
MGVPALFRWLSRKYPKIVLPVVEDQPVTLPGGPDSEGEVIPVDMSGPNPNGEEFDCLYLDMNGIVHPCTHPEGKPAPKTEEDMMREVFLYTDRVVSMVRPRKLLMMAIDGVAPRAKMNQQRSRRFRAAQEAKQKEDDRQNAIKEWEAMGKEVSDEFRNEKGWDSNAITPGTPFMDLLAKSLRYWVRKKINEDPGWAGLEVIISDASVPGEGEHKIMDFIRRQRAHPSHDPNTKHVIYGLDADLIMLSLATHEPHFRVLREDVFADEKKKRGCHRCGQPGHHSSQCTGEVKKPEADLTPKGGSPLKPFIFLDVAILREYLAVELSAPVHSFPFSLERALDDWVFLIFFVGNDFLPHLPSLEIREGAIDTLMTIWKSSLDRMGGYLTEHGKVRLERAQVILEQLAMREDEIFRKRREAEERQDRSEKRRRIDREQQQQPHSMRNSAQNHSQLSSGSGQTHRNGIDYVEVNANGSAATTASNGPGGLPNKPTWAAGEADKEADKGKEQEQEKGKGAVGLVGSNASIVANRKALRMANLSAADMLKAELAGGEAPAVEKGEGEKDEPAVVEEKKAEEAGEAEAKKNAEAAAALKAHLLAGDGEDPAEEVTSPRGTKRPAPPEPADAEMQEAIEEEADDAQEDAEVNAFLQNSLLPPKPATVAGLGVDQPPPLKMLGNNVVEQDDTVKLWEPGYKERYYRQKFGVELSDVEFRKEVVKHYVEGLCWVLEYYYQGTPSWQWYYPYHFSPFASDFVELAKLDIKFDKGQPFKPYEQLMGVFPAASRIHLPEPFQQLMIQENSPILDFYPEEFHIDMNGKKMLWQGVALLPFIDQTRLLDAMATKYPQLTDYENSRNSMGKDVMLVGNKHPLYDYLEGLYGKKKVKDHIPIDTKRSKGISGSVIPDEDNVPSATFDSPLPSMPDIVNDESISAGFAFPPQTTPHRSVLLPGVKLERAVLTPYDKDQVRRGGGERVESNGFHAMNSRGGGPGFAKLDRGGRGGAGGGYGGTPQGGRSYGGGPPGRDSPGGSYGYGSQGGYSGGGGGAPSYGAGGAGGYGDGGGGGGGGGYGGPPAPSYGQGYGGYGGGGYGGGAPAASYGQAPGGYIHPPSGYIQPPLPGGYRPPPAPAYGGYAPPAPQPGPGGARYPSQQPPSYGGYGGYGGQGGQGGSGYGGYGGQGGGGRRY